MLMYREELDQAHCECKHPEGHPDCGHDALYAHPTCHKNASTWFSYSNGVGTVACAECDNPIVEVAIASRPA